MSDFDGYQGVEREFVPRRLTDQDVEALLAGDTGEVAPDLAALGGALDALRDSLTRTIVIDEATAARHVAAAASVATGAARAIPGDADPSPRRRVRAVVRGALSGLTAKILLGTAVALAATGGAAAAGILPAPVQDAVARGARVVGIELPSGRHAESPSTTIPDPEAGSTIPGLVTTTTLPAPSGGEGTTGATGATATPLSWTGTACDGSRATISYTLDAGGILHITDTNGEPAEATDHRIEVGFGDSLVIRIEAVHREEAWSVVVSRHGSCDEGDQDATTTTVGNGENGENGENGDGDDETVDGTDEGGTDGDQEADDTKDSGSEGDAGSDQGTSSDDGSDTDHGDEEP